MNLLSIDWDYFFPNISEYDWQMNENKFIYYELIWHIRWSTHNIKGTKIAKDAFHINNNLLNDFWEKVLEQSFPIILYCTDAHTDIKRVFQEFPHETFNVWNFDQHHDLGYSGNDPNLLDCGNWADYFKDKIDTYNLVYPSWRLKKGEDIDFDPAIKVHYKIPSALPKFDVIFICRSSPFTPPWNDKQWLNFIHYFKSYPHIWRIKRSAPYVMKERPFNLDEAKAYEQQCLDLMNGLKSNEERK